MIDPELYDNRAWNQLLDGGGHFYITVPDLSRRDIRYLMDNDYAKREGDELVFTLYGWLTVQQEYDLTFTRKGG